LIEAVSTVYFSFHIRNIKYVIDNVCANSMMATSNKGDPMSGLSSLLLFKNLSDETRLSIVMLLREAGELCVCEIIGVLNESQPKISRHLAMLRETGLLMDRRDGKWIYYRLSPHMPAWAAAIIEQAFLSEQDKIIAQAKGITRNQNMTGGKALCQ